MVLPAPMQSITDMFNADVNTKGKMFLWSFTRGFVTLEMTIGEERNKASANTSDLTGSAEKEDGDNVVVLQMLPIQAMVLLLFQGEEHRTFSEIMQAINGTERLLKYVMNSLVFSRFQVGFGGKEVKSSC